MWLNDATMKQDELKLSMPKTGVYPKKQYNEIESKFFTISIFKESNNWL